MNLEIKLLKGFVEVARGNSFTRAAERLHVSQSALTLQLRKLEAQLGASLFERSPRGLGLTGAGRELLPLAQRMVNDYAVGAASAQRFREAQGRLLQLGSASYTIEIPERFNLFESFLRAHPKCRLRINPHDQTELIRMTEEGLIDAAIILGDRVSRRDYDHVTQGQDPCEGVYPDHLRTIVLRRRRIGLLVPCERDLARRSAIIAGDLRGLEVAMIDRRHAPTFFEPVRAYLAAAGAQVTIPPESDGAGVELYARSRRICAISLGFGLGAASKDAPLVPRSFGDLHLFCDLVVLALRTPARAFAERFLVHAGHQAIAENSCSALPPAARITHKVGL